MSQNATTTTSRSQAAPDGLLPAFLSDKTLAEHWGAAPARLVSVSVDASEAANLVQPGRVA